MQMNMITAESLEKKEHRNASYIHQSSLEQGTENSAGAFVQKMKPDVSHLSIFICGFTRSYSRY